MREKKCYVNLIMAIVLLVVAFVVYKNIPIAKDHSTLVEKDGDIENNYVEINVKNIASLLATEDVIASISDDSHVSLSFNLLSSTLFFCDDANLSVSISKRPLKAFKMLSTVK